MHVSAVWQFFPGATVRETSLHLLSAEDGESPHLRVSPPT